jgi:hypothetical protein
MKGSNQLDSSTLELMFIYKAAVVRAFNYGALNVRYDRGYSSIG